MKYILWDIDGTLIRTGGASLKSLEQAMIDLYGQEIKIDFSCAGRTDPFIANELFKKLTNCANLDPTKEIPAILNRYLEILPTLIETHKHLGTILPNVQDILEHLNELDTCTSVLLTGNIAKGARAKLTAYNINHFFNYELSGFGDKHDIRNNIAADCFQKIRLADPSATPDDLFVVGDTLHDIACANHIGARCIAVATNNVTSVEALAQANPWHVCQELPCPTTFAKLISY